MRSSQVRVAEEAAGGSGYPTYGMRLCVLVPMSLPMVRLLLCLWPGVLRCTMHPAPYSTIEFSLLPIRLPGKQLSHSCPEICHVQTTSDSTHSAHNLLI